MLKKGRLYFVCLLGYKQKVYSEYDLFMERESEEKTHTWHNKVVPSVYFGIAVHVGGT